jgi:prepilin-type N-terminal cleavage/methylation domain-containing protein
LNKSDVILFGSVPFASTVSSEVIFHPPARIRVSAASSCAAVELVRPCRHKGFSLLEVLVVIGIITVLLAILLAVVNKSRYAAQGAACVANLHSISLALTHDARDHGDRYPDPVALNMSWEQCLRPYLSNSQIFQCLADNEIYPAVGSSYDWRDTGVANTTLAGRTVHDTNRSTAVLTFESLPGWHGPGRINAGLLDGSAQSMDQRACLSDVQTPIR